MIALGILSAIGGFVDIGDLVFNADAGAAFGYHLLWVIVVGVTGIVVYAEMCGRVAAASGRPVFDAIRERMGYRTGMVTLIASTFVNCMTMVAEVGGMALALQLLCGLPYRVLIVVAGAILLVVLLKVSFSAIENTFSMMGLSLIVFAVAAVKLSPDWGHVAHGFVPSIPHSTSPETSMAVYGFFVVGLLGAALTPYEVYFYSSGAVEDHWTLRDLFIDKFTAIVGFGLGGLLSCAIMISSAVVFLPKGISPEFLGTIALPPQIAFGVLGLVLSAVGFFFATGGAAVETALSAIYNIAQFNGWEWGKYRAKLKAPRFTVALVAIVVLGTGVALSGIDAIKLTEYSVIFSSVTLPMTYLPILLVANDRQYMGDKVNGKFANVLGVFYFLVIIGIALCAVPLMLLSHGGQG
jgi:Mn2+/Fe2+ NRAMP family transporter